MKDAVTEPSNSEGLEELKTQNNIDNKESSCQNQVATINEYDSLVNIIRHLVQKYSLEAVKRALVESQGSL